LVFFLIGTWPERDGNWTKHSKPPAPRSLLILDSFQHLHPQL
jgi:hypothetical protein